jgi:hypothetical protein
MGTPQAWAVVIAASHTSKAATTGIERMKNFTSALLMEVETIEPARAANQ